MSQCFHCGDIPLAINMGFDMDDIDAAIEEGVMRQYWECDKCKNVNYEKTRTDRYLLRQLKEAWKNHTNR